LRDVRRSIFLEKSSYRRRRSRDGSRLLPFLALFLFFVPGLWQLAPNSEGVSTAQALTFLFAVWCVVIAITGFLTRYLTSPVIREGETDKEGY